MTVEKQDEHEEKEDMFNDKRSLRLVTVLQCIETYRDITCSYKNGEIKKTQINIHENVLGAVQL